MVHRQEPLNRLYFNNYSVVHQHVESITVELDTVVNNRDELLSHDFLPSFPQFVRQTCAVNAFEQTWPES